jgi:hypothetical protein
VPSNLMELARALERPALKSPPAAAAASVMAQLEVS